MISSEYRTNILFHCMASVLRVPVPRRSNANVGAVMQSQSLRSADSAPLLRDALSSTASAAEPLDGGDNPRHFPNKSAPAQVQPILGALQLGCAALSSQPTSTTGRGSTTRQSRQSESARKAVTQGTQTVETEHRQEDHAQPQAQEEQAQKGCSSGAPSHKPALDVTISRTAAEVDPASGIVHGDMRARESDSDSESGPTLHVVTLSTGKEVQVTDTSMLCGLKDFRRLLQQYGEEDRAQFRSLRRHLQNRNASRNAREKRTAAVAILEEEVNAQRTRLDIIRGHLTICAHEHFAALPGGDAAMPAFIRDIMTRISGADADAKGNAEA